MIYSRPMYNWVLDTIINDYFDTDIELLIATSDDEFGRSIFYNIARDYNHTVSNIVIPYPTRGPVETCKLCVDNFNSMFWVLDNDILYDKNIRWNKPLERDQVYVIVQKITEKLSPNEYSPYSHVVLKDDMIIDIVEKKNISDYIVLGAYGFGSSELYSRLFNIFSEKKELISNEWFMSNIIKLAIEEGYKVNAIESENSIAIGTPDQLQSAIVNNIILPRPLRWVFDLDQTLVTLPSKKNDYTSVEPLLTNIEFLRKLYNEGHYIIIYTARHMRTCNGNVALVKERMQKIVETTLFDFDIPYNELVFGKPYGDVYVDDKSVNPTHWQDNWTLSNLGFGWELYLNQQVNRKILKINSYACVKIADRDEAFGNLHFIKTIPENLVEYTPKLYDCIKEENKYHLLMEWKNDVIPLGKMISYDTLTDDVFYKSLELLKEIHKANIPITVNDELVKKNYFPKFYSRYLDNLDIFKTIPVLNLSVIRDFFDSYKPDIIGCIHGDYWLSNLLWCPKEKKVYMIDMRGRLENTFTTNGDKNYDYAKFLQSLVGFNNVINCGENIDDDVSDLYIKKFIDFFEISPEELQNIKNITALLILGSIPFHEELYDKLDIIVKIVGKLWSNIF